MLFQLFDRFPTDNVDQSLPGNFSELVACMREAALTRTPEWAGHSTMVDYAQICSWAIRKLEYGFVTRAFADFEARGAGSLRVLDLGCGVVPLANWMSRRGHRVCALDPTYDDIALLVRNNANAFYGSRVLYLTGRGEQLPFPDVSFDVVTCVSVLEHVAPGNDRLVMWEIARVLKPGGHLLMTFDVAPPRNALMGECSYPSQVRRHGDPYSPATAGALLRKMTGVFAVSAADLPREFERLTWEDVHAFWRASQAHDGRKEVVRDYLAIGGVLPRSAKPMSVTPIDGVQAYLEGQAAIEERRAFFAFHAAKRLEVIDGQKEVIDGQKEVIDGQKEVIANLERRVETLAKGQMPEEDFRPLRPDLWLLAIAKRVAGRFLHPGLGNFYQYPSRPLRVPTRYRRPRLSGSCPVISIVTPTFNSAQFLERTIRSIIDQGYEGLECIVQDGGSTDDTLDVLERHRARIASVETRKDKGQADALNAGFRRATGEILAYLNSDDLLLPGALHYVAQFFSRHGDVDVMYGHRVVIDEYDEEVGRWVLPPHDDDILAWADWVPQETLFWRRRIWERVGARFDDSFQFAMDWDLLLRFREAGARFARAPRFLGAFRVHASQKTSTQLSGLGAREMARLRERVHGRPVSPPTVDRHILPYLRRHLIYDRLYRLGLLRY